MTISNNYPTIRPSLLLDFANTKQLDPRVTFSRPTVARYYDEKTSVVAEQNLVRFSQGTGMAANWSADSGGSSTKTDNYAVAPDGTTTAMRFVTSNPAYPNMSQIPGGTFTGTYTLSFWASVPSGTLVIPSGSFPSPGTATTTWQRFTVTGTLSSATLIVLFNFGGAAALGIELLIWGVQLEQRSTVTAYTPTTTAAITNYVPVLLTAPVNEARFDHNPITRESLGLLIEEQRTNLLLRSEDFDNTYWDIKSNSSITANTLVSPDGTLDADKLVESTANGQHWVGANNITPITGGVTYTLSIYVKQGERGYVALQGDAGSGRLGFPTVFNLTNGTVFSVGAGTTAAISLVGNGWYRCAVTATSSSTGFAYPYIGLRQNSDPANSSYTGNGFSGLYIWGAQLEAGAFATSYIPTVISQVTRSADIATMTGVNFSSWFNQAEGTYLCDYAGSAPGGFGIFAMGPGGYASPQSMNVFTNSTETAIFYAPESYPDVNFLFSRQNGRLSFAYSNSGAGSFAANVNGGTVSTTTGAYSNGAFSSLWLGVRNPGQFWLNGTMKKLAYYPVRVTNTNLQSLTGS